MGTELPVMVDVDRANMNYEYEDQDIDALILLRAQEVGLDLSRTVLLAPLDNMTDQLEIQLMDELERNREIGARIILVPINLNNIHWVGLVVRLNEENQVVRIQYIDPRGESTSEEGIPAEIKMALEVVYKRRMYIENLLLLRQTDGTACGALTVENLLRIAQGSVDTEIVHEETTRRIRNHHINLLEQFRPDLQFNYRQKNNISSRQNIKRFILSFRAQLADSTFWEYLPGRLLLFFGTCCAGKSSIICELEKNGADINCKHFGTFFRPFLVDRFLIQQHPEIPEIPILRKHFSAIEVCEIMEWDVLNPNCSPEYIHIQQSIISKKKYLEKVFASLNVEEVYHKFIIEEVIPQLR